MSYSERIKNMKPPESHAYTLFIMAFEGGSAYWATTDFIFLEDRQPDEAASERVFRKVWYEGESWDVFDVEDPENKLGTMTRKSMEEAFTLMRENHSRHYGDLWSGNDDADTADVWFQLAVLGELTYG